MFPQSNARLLSVSRESGTGAYSEDYDRPASAPTTIWQGNLDAYVKQNIVSALNDNGELNRVLKVTLLVSGDLPVALQPGDVLTYAVGSPRSRTTTTGRVKDFVNPAELPQLPDYYKCALEDIKAP